MVHKLQSLTQPSSQGGYSQVSDLNNFITGMQFGELGKSYIKVDVGERKII